MRVVLILILFLAGCASPAPRFIGAERQDITLEGIRFAVFQQGTDAEVIRLGYLTRAQRAKVPELMEIAVMRSTGCRTVPNSLRSRIPGDTGEARFSLDCDVRVPGG
ncbi:hypothetical protein [Paracoccus sulfuroxidans]|uniref:Lipoprotein n=1 Tax=Paracoccus sulfuroxidans TaxID=384678 RepID=A0A562NV58_9RHOB|nr:hypothetical protein [Paracoccus sulfuroxidans]TWI36049.1 hypothetical protein IQ24_01412 [Paracoccus sulfuroxidans]